MIKCTHAIILCVCLSNALLAQEADQLGALGYVGGTDQAVLEIYDIRDLVRTLVDETRPDNEETRQEKEAEKTELLAEIIGNFIVPPLRENKEEVKALGVGIVVARARPEQQEWIRTLFENHRTLGSKQLLFDIKVIVVPKSVFEESFPPGLARLEKYNREGATIFTLETARIDEALVKWKRLEKVNILSAPRVLVSNSQRAQVQAGTGTRYIADYEVFDSVEPRKQRVVVPVIKSIEEGLEFNTLATLITPDLIALDFSITIKRIERPIPTLITEHGEIALPSVQKRALSTKVMLVPGQTIVARIEEDNPAGSGAPGVDAALCTAHFITVQILDENGLNSIKTGR